MPFEQVANVVMSERESAMVVVFEELQIVVDHSITFPLPVNHSIENYKVRIFNLGSQFLTSPLALQLIFQDEQIKESFPQL